MAADNNGKPVYYDENGYAVYRAVCDICGAECVTAVYPHSLEDAPDDWVYDKVGRTPQRCDDHPLEVEAPPPEDPNPVPRTITPAQIRIAALIAYKIQPEELDAIVESVIEEALPTDAMKQAARVKWEYATVIEREHPLIAAVAYRLQKNSGQVDDLFRLAVTL